MENDAESIELQECLESLDYVDHDGVCQYPVGFNA